jgi:hypothetical protein
MTLQNGGEQRRFDMPTAFGPSAIPDCSHVPKASIVGVSFLTDSEPLAAMLPPGFALGVEPVVSVSFLQYSGVDYLGGRGYQEVVVSFPAIFHASGEELTGGYPPVLWVSDPGALMAGREYMGLPKLMGSFSFEESDEIRRFTCRELDETLIDGNVTGLRPLSVEQLAKVMARAQQVQTFGWKHIPGPGGSVDVAYPLINVMRWEYERAWTGEGRVLFHNPDAGAAPFSWRAAAAFAALPVREWRRSFVGEGRAVIDRAATRRIG